VISKKIYLFFKHMFTSLKKTCTRPLPEKKHSCSVTHQVTCRNKHYVHTSPNILGTSEKGFVPGTGLGRLVQVNFDFPSWTIGQEVLVQRTTVSRHDNRFTHMYLLLDAIL